MDWCLIGFWLFKWATWSWIVSPSSWLIIFLVALGLGTVIFVHELGHFAVAKLCGVKCEKFYLGFDIGGWKLWKFQWGETEYGIGVLPLGGYVKMLGQEDNPARLKEEIERAKAAKNADEATAETMANSLEGEQIDLAAAEAALYDPRSYLAQSVPRRMAIISAGVIMNLIFAFIMAVIAYSLGVTEQPCEIGQVQPGFPAWQYDLRPGDKMVMINGKPARRFRDLQTRIPLTEKSTGARLRIERPGVKEPINLTIHPNRDLLVPMIGAAAPGTTTLQESNGWLNSEPVKPYVRGGVVAQAKPAFEPGDKIVQIDGVKVNTAAELREALSAHRNQPVQVTVERTAKDGGATETLTINVEPRPMRRVGLVMEMGDIKAVQHHSPAAKAGIKAGDRIIAVDGKPPGDPLRLPDRLWKKAKDAVAEGKSAPTVMLTIKRREKAESEGGKKKEEETLDIPVTLRVTDRFETPLYNNSPVSVPSLGVAYMISNTVAAVVPDSPAAEAGIKPGDVLVEASLVPPSDEELEKVGLKPGDISGDAIPFTKKKHNWGSLFYTLQEVPLAGFKLKLEYKSGDEEKTATLAIVDDRDWFNPERGFKMQPVEFTLTAKSFGEALKLGGEETWLQATLVLRLLNRLGKGEISFKVLGGPVTIAKVAGAAASKGIPDFLLFLTMISATLAVINFLPIPILDGGHFVFLLYEGIRGKPADERVQLALSYLGLLVILGLMVWVLGLDFKLIPRQ